MNEMSAGQSGQTRVLVMGGLGFIGSHLCRALLERGYRVHIFDKLYCSHRLIADIEERVEIHEGDMLKAEDVLDALQGVEVAVNLVHTSVPGSSMSDPSHDLISNAGAAARWLPRIGETGLKRILYISSGGTVYGPARRLPIDEEHPTHPRCAYGISKLAVEKYTALYADLGGVAYRICRPSNVYGSGQHLNIGQGVIGVYLHRALHGLPLEVWGDGSQQRDFLFIDDFVAAIIALIGHQGEERIFNVSSGIGVTLNELITLVGEAAGKPVSVAHQEARPFDVHDNVLSNRLLTQATGWRPAVELAEGLRRIIPWASCSSPS
jgi:UDP-glucose 4-epimerase